MLKRKKPGFVKPLTMTECKKIESGLKKKASRLSPQQARELKEYMNEGLERAAKTGAEPDGATVLHLMATWFAKQEVKKKRE